MRVSFHVHIINNLKVELWSIPDVQSTRKAHGKFEDWSIAIQTKNIELKRKETKKTQTVSNSTCYCSRKVVYFSPLIPLKSVV
jgi:N-acetyl-gamma-glutamylphosphate reductase